MSLSSYRNPIYPAPRVEQTWGIDPIRGCMVLEMSVVVNGEKLAVCQRMDPLERIPSLYIEREMRHLLMREVEKRLFGDTK